MTHATVASAKAALRLVIRNRRKALMIEHPEAHWLAAEAGKDALSARFPDGNGKVAALYRAMGSELDPRHVGDWLASQGWILALPYIDADKTMSFRRWKPGDAIVRDAADLPAPAPTAERLEPDLIVAPLLAFDRLGHRLGQGAGWYDRTVADLRARKDVWVMGLAYSGQELASIPAEDHDERLDAILTEAGYRLAEPEAASPQNQDQ